MYSSNAAFTQGPECQVLAYFLAKIKDLLTVVFVDRHQEKTQL